MATTILVSNRLPIRVQSDGSVIRTTGGLASALAGSDIEATWVGWPGIAAEDVGDEACLAREMEAVRTKPVLLKREELDGYYDGFSNATIWPLLHYMIERAEFDTGWFRAYRDVNEKFAEAILAVIGEGDNVWIHDYHLFLLPAMLRRKSSGVRIGFFLHTPFPSSEIFRALPQREDILEGLLGADLIGFHTYNYLRHFRSSVLRVLGIESELETIWHGERAVRLGVYPIGHDHRGFSRALESPEFSVLMEKLQRELQGKKLVLSVERLDYTKGIPQKLAAIRDYLERHSEVCEETLFVIIAVPSRCGIREYDQLTEIVQREVGAINGEFGTVGHSPVQFLHRSFPQQELAALYAIADVCLVTPLVDGMNLVAKEYIDCKEEACDARPGVLVLSEFAGAAQEMSHALLVNPHDIEATSEAISTALLMSADEKWKRIREMQGRLRLTDSAAWASGFLSDLQSLVPAHGVESSSEGLRAILPRLVPKEEHGESAVVLFLDYDGTLRAFTRDPDEAIPDEELGPLLQRIASIGGIKVALVSGRKAEFLESHFAGLGVTLIAEHGYRLLRAGLKTWELVHGRVDTDWKQDVLPHLEQAARLTPGSHVEEKQSALVWHYRRADPEFGLWRAHGLLAELTDVTSNLPVSVHHGKKIVEVASQLVNKGEAVKMLLAEWAPRTALIAGDDQTDETMFALEPTGVEFFTVNVGQGATRAAFRTDLQGLREFLEDFAGGVNS